MDIDIESGRMEINSRRKEESCFSEQRSVRLSLSNKLVKVVLVMGIVLLFDGGLLGLALFGLDQITDMHKVLIEVDNLRMNHDLARIEPEHLKTSLRCGTTERNVRLALFKNLAEVDLNSLQCLTLGLVDG